LSARLAGKADSSLVTTPAAEEFAVRARSFGAIARDYDRARPSYIAALVDDVVALLPGRDVVEIGAGTGKATELFGARGLAMTCVEPDPEMAAVLVENTRQLPNVTVTVSSFEDFQPARLFDGLIAAQSWHWTSPENRWRKAAGVLREGGVIALFWNREQAHLTPLGSAVADVYRRYGIDDSKRPNPERTPPAWPGDELEKQPTFADVEVRAYDSVHSYSTAQWLAYAASTSHLIIREPAQREAILSDIAKVIDDGGGVLEIHRRCDLYLARRTAVPV
jgi:SAM-dependent methyltransferase